MQDTRQQQDTEVEGQKIFVLGRRLLDQPEKNVRAASKAETYVHIPQEMMASGDGNERLAVEGREARAKEALAPCALARTGSQPKTEMG